MTKSILKKIWLPSILCIAMISFLLPYPMTCYGEEESCGDYEISVNVAANIIIITSQGEGHAVVVHTLQHYDNVDRDETEVFVEDCPITSFGQREDDNLHLDIYFPLDELKLCEDALVINSEFNILRVEGVDTEKCEFWGESYIHIVGKQGPGR